MQKSIARTSPRELEGAAFIDKRRERPGPSGFFPEVFEANNQQLERVSAIRDKNQPNWSATFT
jgi:hypothetical protein